MIATTTEPTVVSDAVTTRIRTGRGAQVAFLRNGRLAFVTLISTTVEVNGADDVLSRRYQPRLLLGSLGCRETPTQRFVSDPVTESVRYFHEAAVLLVAAGWMILPDNSRLPGRHVNVGRESQHVVDALGVMPDVDHFTCGVWPYRAVFTLGLDPADTGEVLVDRVFTPRPGGAGERERWSVSATRSNFVAAGEVTGRVGTRHQFRPVTSKRKVQFVALGTEVLLHREWVTMAELPAVVAAATGRCRGRDHRSPLPRPSSRSQQRTSWTADDRRTFSRPC